jgi:hypothetical protein
MEYKSQKIPFCSGLFVVFFFFSFLLSFSFSYLSFFIGMFLISNSKNKSKLIGLPCYPMRFICLLALLTFIHVVLSTPVICAGTTSALEFETESGIAPPETDPCEGLVCQYNCPRCQKVIVFNLNNILTTSNQMSQYQVLCNLGSPIEKMSNNFLFEATKNALLGIGQPISDNVSNFLGLINTVSSTQPQIGGATFLVSLAAEYRIFGKVCTKKKGWKTEFHQKVNDIYDRNYLQFQRTFSRDSNLLRETISGGLSIKQHFISSLKGELEYCHCRALSTLDMNQGRNSRGIIGQPRAFQQMYQRVLDSTCNQSCSTTTLEIEEEEEEE